MRLQRKHNSSWDTINSLDILHPLVLLIWRCSRHAIYVVFAWIPNQLRYSVILAQQTTTNKQPGSRKWPIVQSVTIKALGWHDVQSAH